MLENAAATAVGLYVIILIIGPVSGAHLNPVVSMAEVILRRLPIPVALTSTGNTARIPAAVGAYIGAAYFFTSSTSFANPAITIGRIFSDTFAGIAPASAPPYLAAQLVGGLLGLLTVRLLYPTHTASTPDSGAPLSTR